MKKIVLFCLGLISFSIFANMSDLEIKAITDDAEHNIILALSSGLNPYGDLNTSIALKLGCL